MTTAKTNYQLIHVMIKQQITKKNITYFYCVKEKLVKIKPNQWKRLFKNLLQILFTLKLREQEENLVNVFKIE